MEGVEALQIPDPFIPGVNPAFQRPEYPASSGPTSFDVNGATRETVAFEGVNTPKIPGAFIPGTTPAPQAPNYPTGSTTTWFDIHEGTEYKEYTEVDVPEFRGPLITDLPSPQRPDNPAGSTTTWFDVYDETREDTGFGGVDVPRIPGRFSPGRKPGQQNPSPPAGPSAPWSDVHECGESREVEDRKARDEERREREQARRARAKERQEMEHARQARVEERKAWASCPCSKTP
ncbi:hypothetical protein FB451DRAFT_293926 [Mycena latifolia]|nr:hypothetical protein FB451DRAFT_293926 [Mycena latifolia]